jgi:CheY-like chemotaxis protein
VLVVDDDALTRESLATLINGEEGWEAVTADDGLAALELLRSGLRPDLAVFDLRMPRLDGRALLTRVREDPNLRRMPVVIASGQQDRELIRSLAQLRISGYLLKPIDLAKARATLLQAAGVTVSA